MRSLSLVSLPLCLFACGDVVSNSAKRAASPGSGVEQASTPRIERATAPPAMADAALPELAAATAPLADASAPVLRTAPVGSLEHPHALRHVYEALARLEDGQSHDDVRILQYGDSHTASDLPTAAMRRALQARFGDGGRGFVAIGKPWKRYVQDGVQTGMTPEFAPEKGRVAGGRFSGDGAYGLLGIAVAAQQPAKAWVEVSAISSRIELGYLEQPNGGSFDVFIDHAKVMRLSSKGAKPQSAWRAFDLTDGAHHLEVATVGDGDVRLFGATFDRATAGVHVDSLGINGAQIYTALGWSEPHFAEQLKHRAPDLVIFAYGTNESLNETAPDAYERKLVDLLGRSARAVPTASCLLLGPPDRGVRVPARHGAHRGQHAQVTEDWQTAPKIEEIIASQRRVAEAAGCAFFNQFDAMGGKGSIATWAKDHPPRAIRDRIHLTRDGYVQLANAFVKDLLEAYATWRTDNGLAPTSAPQPAALPTTIPDAAAPPQRVRPRARRGR